jgi:probable F420-dependent oxidoreductase
MQFGVQLPHLGPLVSGEGTVALARRAEALGFDSAWVGDHVVYPAGYAARFGEACFEAVTMLTWVGARTERIRLGTGVLVLPYRNPLVLGKQMATLDALCGGRTIVGVGVGWLEEEFEAVGASFADRGAVTDEHLRVMRALWEQEEPAFEGALFRFAAVCARPRPAQRPAPPVWIGGNTPRALRRTAALGDGWLPIWHAPTGRGYAPAALADARERLAAFAAAAGRGTTPEVAGLLPLAFAGARDWQPLAPAVGEVAQVIDALCALAEAGLGHVILSPFYGVPAPLLPGDLAQVEALLQRFMEEVAPAVAAAGGSRGPAQGAS